MADHLTIKPESECTWDIVSLGEVMLRFDPGDDRIHTARSFRVWEGGGEYNVARNIAKCFRHRAAIVTALADNQIGRLVEDLIHQGGVDASQILWRETDGISRGVRNGMYFMERGFGSRPPTGCSDRGNTAVSQLKPGVVDWKSIFTETGTRWFHTGGIFAGLSKTTAEVAAEAMRAAKESSTIVSYDLNYRESLWSGRGGRTAANRVNRELLEFADVVFGVEKFDASVSAYSDDAFAKAASSILLRHPNIQVLATTLRDVHTASRHSVSGACFANGETFTANNYNDVDVLDRVGSGDAFAAGLIYGILSGTTLQTAVDLAAASSVLSMASLGDGSSATLAEIKRLAASPDSMAVR
ncbi:MAG: sugar kinase [Acidobacteriota bacterium]